MGLSQTTVSRGHEHRDISFGAVVTFALALAIALVVVHFVIGGVYRRLASQSAGYPMSSSLSTAPAVLTGPGLLVDQSADMEKLRASEEAVLKSYGWVDRDHGIVRIPIDRAIELLVETNSGALR